MSSDKTLRTILAVLALVGIALGAYLLTEHYAPSGSSFCDVSVTVSCDVVNQSPYAELFGIPVSLFGILYYLGILAFALLPGKLATLLADGDRELLWTFLAAYAIFGFAFSLYLTSIEAFVLHVWCLLCVLSAIMVTFILAMAGLRARKGAA